jgi:DNA-binding CsgD family transcriptional regulator
MQVMVNFMAGDGLDERRLAEALRVGDEQDSAMPVAFRPRMQQAMLLAWTGQLEEARRQMQAIRRRCIEGGEESEWMFVAFNSFQVETWLGDFAEAALVAEDCTERAEMIGGDVPRLAALTMRATLAAYTGRADEARRDAREALTAGQRIGSSILAGWATNVVGFLEVSAGDYAAALSALSPLIAKLNKSPESTEIFVASFVPDLVEAQVRLGRITEAEPLIDRLESNGRRLDRPWMLAIGGRCRAMWLAAGGDLDAASRVALQAVIEHDRLPMPFERARTELLVGQLERRQRRNRSAEAHLRSALDTFERLGTPLWAERARLELGRANVGPHRDTTLTPSEQRVAELAASGMTNRAIASALFISPKTVEANLSRIYRKLNINSRVALGNNMAQEH